MLPAVRHRWSHRRLISGQYTSVQLKVASGPGECNCNSTAFASRSHVQGPGFDYALFPDSSGDYNCPLRQAGPEDETICALTTWAAAIAADW